MHVLCEQGLFLLKHIITNIFIQLSLGNNLGLRIFVCISTQNTYLCHGSARPPTSERSRQGVGTGHESSNFAASHYLT